MYHPTYKDIVRIFKKHQTIKGTAEELGVSRKTIRRRLSEAGYYQHEDNSLKTQIKNLQSEIKKLKKDQMNQRDIRRFIFELSERTEPCPSWLIDKKDNEKDAVPCIMLSDLHWGETIEPEQVFNRNSYNQDIAKERLEIFIQNVIDFFKNKMNFTYNGITINLNGDLLSGDIHEELTKSNEEELMKSFLTLKMELVKVLTKLADSFGNVFIACTPGNHSRNTQKKTHKNKAHTNFDWLLYCLLEQWFQTDSRFSFSISEGDELQYDIYEHSFRLTHGDQFSGGFGLTGATNPISKGNMKKQLASMTYNLEYDTLLIGHFHQTMILNDCIANGSLVGYSEFSMQNNMPYEDPKQMVWLVHPDLGIICSTGLLAI